MLHKLELKLFKKICLQELKIFKKFYKKMNREITVFQKIIQYKNNLIKKVRN